MTEYGEILRVCGGAVLAMVCAMVLRSADRSGIGGAVTLCFSVLLTIGALQAVVPTLSALLSHMTLWVDDAHTRILFRGMAACFTLQTTSDLIRDAGEGALAERVDMLGRAVLLAIGLPLIEELLALAKSFLLP